MIHKCPRCGNDEKELFGCRKGQSYCRKCVSFIGQEASINAFEHNCRLVEPHINYELSLKQKEISNRLIQNYEKGLPTLVYAVCGAGKTEIVFALIALVISQGEVVGFAVPRRDVVVELYERLKEVFAHCKVVAVYGDHHESLIGEIIVLTTHQLYRYNNAFALLIIDEIDAFPYKNSDILHTFALRSYYRSYVLMSATPSRDIIKRFQQPGYCIEKLMSRYHGDSLPVPRIVLCIRFIAIIKICRLLKKFAIEQKPVFVFCPTIRQCTYIYNILRLFLKNGECVHSKAKRRSEIIEAFKKGNYAYLITTSVLERGITIKNLQVIIYNADHRLYDWATLVQISGRVGRKVGATKGEVVFFAEEHTEEMEYAIKNIKDANLHM